MQIILSQDDIETILIQVLIERGIPVTGDMRVTDMEDESIQITFEVDGSFVNPTFGTDEKR